jgi:cytochrome c-type biogenesis protein CcmE
MTTDNLAFNSIQEYYIYPYICHIGVSYNHAIIGCVSSNKNTGVTLEQNSQFNNTKPGFKLNKFLVGGLLMLAAVVLLVITSLKGNAQYYLTIDELVSGKVESGTSVRVSGVVLGDTITYDPRTMNLTFTAAHIPGDNDEIEALGGLAAVLHAASVDADANQLVVVYTGIQPDLLTNEAQAIMTGKLGEDGIFYADELLLKCPSRYEEGVPSQAAP